MGLIIFIGGCYFIGQQVKIMKQEIQYESYDNGYLQGYYYGNLNLVNQINDNGQIPVRINETNIQWVSLEQLCGGGK